MKRREDMDNPMSWPGSLLSSPSS
ncbi:hypothetical protein FQN60_012050 [Etheostoma spectabile]|uniref:Uncharacterized protein n=1 Tax=Etheostoma spectabile TaxID=54343 RepID=A0A5J5DNK8_9PERO|nr:hypothetical protein FQN60_012050 [Etheostoma spectabile]